MAINLFLFSFRHHRQDFHRIYSDLKVYGLLIRYSLCICINIVEVREVLDFVQIFCVHIAFVCASKFAFNPSANCE